jgi:hypothetical protein
MPTNKQKTNKEFAFKFLMEENSFAAEERWKYTELNWEAFRFYMTLVTGSVAFILALSSAKLDLSSFSAVVSISSGIIFIIGILVYLRMIVLSADAAVVRKRLRIIRKLIFAIAPLKGYFNSLHEANADMAFTQGLDYSFRGQFRRAIIGVGLKTQIVVINSFIGMISIVAGAISLKIMSTTPLYGLIILVIVSYIFLIVIHALIGKARDTKSRD